MKGIQIQRPELFKHIIFTINYLEVSTVQKHSTNKFMGQMPGDRGTKKLHIISKLKETHNLKGNI